MELSEVLSTMPLIAVLRGISPGEVLSICDELYKAGFLCLEVPMNSPDPLDSIARLAEAYGDKALVGAGTVVRVDDVEKIAKAGGKIIIMPHTDVEIIKESKRLDLCCVPGFSTPSEAYTALNAGADALKCFPAESHPPAIVKAFRSILPKDTIVIPTGGITPEKMADYFAVGVNGFGLGSALYRPGDTAESVAGKAEKFVAAMKSIL